MFGGHTIDIFLFYGNCIFADQEFNSSYCGSDQLNLWDSNVGKMTLYSRWGQIPSNYRYIFFQRP